MEKPGSRSNSLVDGEFAWAQKTSLLTNRFQFVSLRFSVRGHWFLSIMPEFRKYIFFEIALHQLLGDMRLKILNSHTTSCGQTYKVVAFESEGRVFESSHRR